MLAIAAAALTQGPAAAGAAESGANRLDAPIPILEWQEPPRDARPVARWWWPGGSVEPHVVERQLGSIAAAGFGAVELQPLLLGLGDEELAADARLRTVGLPAFRKAVAHAAAAAAAAGLAFDLTLGSGWPGGLPTAKENAERELLMASLDISGPSDVEVVLPPAPGQSYRGAVEWVLDVLGPPDQEMSLVAVLAGRVGPERDGVPTLEGLRDVYQAVSQGRLKWSVPAGEWRIFALYSGSTEHFVMGGAFPGAEADARVVDHLSRRGADALLEGYATPVVAEIAPGGVRDVFVDSFELMGELPFSESFLEQFEKRAGYDLLPLLPLLFRKGGESKYAEMMDLFGRSGGPVYVSAQPGQAERVREDYESVRRALFEEEFVAQVARWAHDRQLGLRLQAHGGYGDYLDTYALANVPESEGLFGGGTFDFLALAASAAHVAGRTWASSEAFITLRLFGTTVSPDEMRLLAGRAYSAGINRLVFHGVAYPYRRQDARRWFPFPGGFGRILAGPLPMSLDVDEAHLAALPDFNRALGRLSVAMSQGAPAADVAWLRADPIFPDEASLQLGRIEPHAGESPTTGALRARGLVHDRVSRRMLADAHVSGGALSVGAASYRGLLLDPLEVAEPGLVERVAEIAEAGIPVLALGGLPRRAPGLHDAEARDRRVRVAVERLSKRVLRVGSSDLEGLLEQHVGGALVEPVPNERLAVSLDRRRSSAGDTLLVFNEAWSPREAKLRFVRAGGPLLRWEPRSAEPVLLREHVREGDVVSVTLSAAETLILTLGARNATVGPRTGATPAR